MGKHGFGCILVSPTYRLQVGRVVFNFEFHDYMGPGVLNSKGQPIGGHGLPPPHSPFWGAFQRWLDGGKHADAQGNCLFAAPEVTGHAVPRETGETR